MPVEQAERRRLPEVVESLLRDGGVDYETGQFSFQPNRFSSNSTAAVFMSYRPPVVAVGDDFGPLTEKEMVARVQRRLGGKVEPEAARLYTQSVENKRRVKLKPRGGA